MCISQEVKVGFDRCNSLPINALVLLTTDSKGTQAKILSAYL